ncbi:LamG-like jellyroll fold domain-containing protein [Bacteroides sp.]
MKYCIIILFVLFTLKLQAKEVLLNFNRPADFDKEYLFSSGVEGKALDLSASASYRIPVSVNQIDSTDMSGSFSIGIWIKSADTYNGTKVLVGNKKSLEMKNAGFMIATQENGSWAVYFTDGKNWQWDYRPTVKRQPINDGKWHFLAITHFAEKQEMKMYYDGENVATYCTNGNVNLATSHPIRLGNNEEEQWHTFNGLLDNFSFVNRVKDDSEIAEEYFRYTGIRHEEKLPEYTASINLMGFNIFHGGHELGEQVGVNRVVEIIKTSGADIIGMIETYGSGAEIADALGYHFYLRSSNLSIMSKYPIEQTWDIFQPFNSCAATIRISQTQTINYVNLWLDYRPLTDDQIKAKMSVEEIEAQELPTRYRELNEILKGMQPFFDRKDIPIFVSGDFNSGSHLDWTKEAQHLFEGYSVKWPTSVLMQEKGFKDSYRELHPDPVKHPCLTWSTMSKLDLQYRIDFIYYQGKNVKAVKSEMIDRHPIRFPSDHAAMITTFKFKK